MKEHKNFTVKSFLQRFVISQLFLNAFVMCILAVANLHPRQHIKVNAEKIASKVISAKTNVSTAQK
jgi:hypothetical protein